MIEGTTIPWSEVFKGPIYAFRMIKANKATLYKSTTYAYPIVLERTASSFNIAIPISALTRAYKQVPSNMRLFPVMNYFIRKVNNKSIVIEKIQEVLENGRIGKEWIRKGSKLHK